MLASNGTFIERKAEANEGQALDAREAAMAELASAMKDLRRATNRLATRMSTAASAAAQICSSCTEISQSLLRLEQHNNQSVNLSLSVASSSMASHHRHAPLPVTPPIRGSITPQVPQIIVPTLISAPNRSPCPNRLDLLPLSTTNSSSSSTSSPFSASTFANSSLFSNSLSVVVPTTEVLRTSITEPLPPLTRIEKPHPHASPDFQFEEPLTTLKPMLPPPHSFPSPSQIMSSPLTKFFTQNCPNVAIILDSENLSDGFLLTDQDQNRAPVLVPVPPLQGLNNSFPVALVVDHNGYAVTTNKGEHTLLAPDDFVQPDAVLENKKIETPVLFRGIAPLLHPVNTLEMKILPVPSPANSANPNTKSLKAPVAIGSTISLVSTVHARSTVRTLILGSLSMIRDRFSIRLEKSSNEQFLVEHERPGYTRFPSQDRSHSGP